MLAEACVPVATHRHGCCVLQRAMDAAIPEQARMLVTQVCINALQLMQVGKSWNLTDVQKADAHIKLSMPW